MPSPQVEKLLATADDKKNQVITGTKLKMNVKGLREGKYGVVINGVVYPIMKGGASTWSLLKSSKTPLNKPIFKKIIEGITAVKGKKERFKAYQKVLAMDYNVDPIASEFAYEYVNSKTKNLNMKRDGDRNLFENQDISMYFDKSYKGIPQPVFVRPVVEPPETKQQEEELQVFDVDAEGRAKAVSEEEGEEDGFDGVDSDDVFNDVDLGMDMDEMVGEYQKELEQDVAMIPPPPPAEPRKRKMRGKKDTKPPEEKKQIPLSERPRTFDPSKYEGEGMRGRFEVIKGKAIRVSKLQRGEFGYVFRNLIFPMWKKDQVGSGSNSWSMVESRMLKQEQELFRRMNKLSNEDAISLYFKFYEDLYLIPTEVLARGLELANNKFTKDLVEGINVRAERNGVNVKEGYNINFQKGEGKEGIFQTVKGFFKLNIDSKKVKKIRDDIADKEFKNLQYTDAEIKQLFSGIDFFEASKKIKQLTEKELSENIQVEREMRSDVRIDADGDIIPPPPAVPPPVPQAQAIPQAPVNVLQNNNIPNIQMETNEGANVGDRQKALDEAKRDEATQPMMDNIPDLSQHGFQVAIQNVFIKYNKDFSFIKNLVEQNPALKPSENESERKQQIDLCYAYYSSLFPLPSNDGDTSYSKTLELATLKFQYRRNVEMENAWKRNLGNLTGQGGGANMGIIVNTEGLGMSASQLFNQQQQQPQAQPAQAPLGNAQAGAVPQAPATAQNPQQQGVAQEPLKTQTPDIQKEYKPQPEQPKPKGKKSGKKTMKQRNVVLNVREKKLNPNLLFTKLNSKNPIPEPVGELPSFRIRTKKKERIKL